MILYNIMVCQDSEIKEVVVDWTYSLEDGRDKCVQNSGKESACKSMKERGDYIKVDFTEVGYRYER